jgi:hypothetical protein
MSIINESDIDEECIYVFSQNILVSTCNIPALFSASVLAGEPSAQGQHLCGENYRCIFLSIILFIVIFGTLISILVIRRSLPENGLWPMRFLKMWRYLPSLKLRKQKMVLIQ